MSNAPYRLVWRDSLPSPRPFPFLDAVVAANEALQELSDLVYFDRHRSRDELTQTALTEAGERFDQALERIALLPEDETTRLVIEALTDLARLVHTEMVGTPGSVTLAEAVVRGALIDPTEEFRTVFALTLLAAEWGPRSGARGSDSQLGATLLEVGNFTIVLELSATRARSLGS